MRLGLVNMDFDYDTYFGVEHSTGYERLLRDCMAGDATLFQRADMVEAGWSVIQPVLDVWHALPARNFRITLPAPGVPPKPTSCSPATAAPGAASARKTSTSAANTSPRKRLPPLDACAGPNAISASSRTPAAITRRAADEFLKASSEAVAKNGVFNVAFAGGSTPKALYSMLADDPAYRAKLAWDKMRVFFGDERHVPPDHSESNFRMASEALFSKGLLKPEQIARIKGEYPDTEKAALEYEQVLRAYFQLKDGEYPRLDLVLLGMGEEGHTLSLFPGTKALHPGARIVSTTGSASFIPSASPSPPKRQNQRQPRNVPDHSRGQSSGPESRPRRSL